jgi:hypothetical protein
MMSSITRVPKPRRVGGLGGGPPVSVQRRTRCPPFVVDGNVSAMEVAPSNHRYSIAASHLSCRDGLGSIGAGKRPPGAGPMSGRDRFARDLRSFRLLVDHGFRNLGQCGIGLLFLLKRLIQQSHGVIQTKFPRPGFERPITGYLIVFDRLRRRQ